MKLLLIKIISNVIILFFVMILLVSCSSSPKMQKQEFVGSSDSFWVVNPAKKTCIHYPGETIDELVLELHRKTGDVCEVTLTSFGRRGKKENLRTILCGDFESGKAWVITESEQTCQDILEAFNTNERKEEFKLKSKKKEDNDEIDLTHKI